MKKFLASLMMIAVSIVFGYWLHAVHLLDHTLIGEGLDWVVEKVPVPEEWDRSPVIETPEEPPTHEQPADSKETQETNSETNEKDDAVDYKKVEDKIFVLLNELREEKGVQSVTKNKQLKKAADVRAKESATSFSHTRPNGGDAFTVFEEKGLAYPYLMAGENLAMGTYYLDEEGMAEFLFNGWVDSPGHYKNMVQKDFEEVGIGVYYDGKILYTTQLFGTPRN